MGRVSAEDWEHVVTRDLLPFLGFGIDLKPRGRNSRSAAQGCRTGRMKTFPPTWAGWARRASWSSRRRLDGGSAAVPVPMYAVRTGRLRSLREMALVRRQQRLHAGPHLS
jgi:hypothetical protein